MIQFATFVVHCGKNIPKVFELYATYMMIMYAANVCRWTQIQETIFIAPNVQPNIQRYLVVYVNIAYMEVVYVVLSQKYHLC